MAKKYTGQCACGAVRFAFDKDPTFIADCYCRDCQKASGGAFATFFGVAEDDFTLLSGKPKPFHYVAESGQGARPQLLPALRRAALHQQPRHLPRDGVRHHRQP